MQVLNQQNMVPPGGWKYEANGQTFKAVTLDQVMFKVRDSYFANGKVPPPNLRLLIQDQICSLIPDPELKCSDASPPSKTDLARRAARALVGFARSGFKLVSQEVLLERRETCEACSFWKGEAVFGMGKCGSCGCTGLKLVVANEKCPENKWKAEV
jgi:hypothetical protein